LKTTFVSLAELPSLARFYQASDQPGTFGTGEIQSALAADINQSSEASVKSYNASLADQSI
jgi:hypothetical protein